MHNNTYLRSGFFTVLFISALLSLSGCFDTSTPLMQDPRLALAEIPSHGWVANDTIRQNIVLVMGLVVAGSFVYALRYWAQTGNPGMVWLIIGAGVTCLIEPFEDVLAGVWYARSGDTLFEYFGRPMPLFMPMLYLAAYGTTGTVFYKMLYEGVTRKKLWLMFLAAALGDILIELPLLNMDGTYIYHGNHPLYFFKFAFWMPVLSGFSFICAPAFVALLTPHLKGLKWLLVPFVMVVSTLALGYSPALTLPAFIAINGNYPWYITELLGLVTMAMCLLFTWGLTQFACTDSPYQLLVRRDKIRKTTA